MLITKTVKNAFNEYISETMLKDHIEEVKLNIKTHSKEHIKIKYFSFSFIDGTYFSFDKNKFFNSRYNNPQANAPKTALIKFMRYAILPKGTNNAKILPSKT